MNDGCRRFQRQPSNAFIVVRPLLVSWYVPYWFPVAVLHRRTEQDQHGYADIELDGCGITALDQLIDLAGKIHAKQQHQQEKHPRIGQDTQHHPEQNGETAGQEGGAKQLSPAFRAFIIKNLFALTMITEIGDVRRFAHPRQLVSWVGMDIRDYASGGKSNRFGITRQGNLLVPGNKSASF